MVQVNTTVASPASTAARLRLRSSARSRYGPTVPLDTHLADALPLPFDVLGVGEARADDLEVGAPLRAERIARSLAG